jgi:hypothetical protein
METSFPDNDLYFKGYYGSPQITRASVNALLLPEGVVQHGQTVTGILYFPNVPAATDGDHALTLTARLSAPDGGTAVARAAIPMRVVR